MLKVIEAAVFLGALVLYLVPAMIADAREREDAFAVTMVNILLGWTVIGWLAALVWARHPVSDRRMKHFARRAQRAVARVTIDAIVARAESRAGSVPVLNPRLVPVVTRIAANRRYR
ncbi:superinfection immunity protein [Paraburkholderia sp. 1N]|uniref:Superinfection immunity protein n=1 Tax=Paraburkholderia solitsugae TaxID=2675748 RepID=A0ABX2C5P8_9BURK|nr:superinfection immunity protein [Paraburkholderia solitsugae]NPT47553.1 superinfection immunity protein [Paraburkholderia solitsugae]